MIDNKRQGDDTTEIEITPQMIEEAKSVLMEYDETCSNREEIIMRIFSVLMDARGKAV
jgi:hypothetical protein